MAIPKNLEDVDTNLPLVQLRKVLEAIITGICRYVRDSVLESASSHEIEFEGVRYRISRSSGVIIDAVYLHSGNPQFIGRLLDELEGQHAKAAYERDRRAAKILNRKLDSLRRALARSQ